MHKEIPEPVFVRSTHLKGNKKGAEKEDLPVSAYAETPLQRRG